MANRGIGSMDEVGIAAGYKTYLSALVRGTDEGKAVMVSSNNTVALVTTGLNFAGVVRTIGDGPTVLTGVQEDGYAEIGYTGGNPSVGWNYLVGGSTAGKVALADEVAVKTVEVTVDLGDTSGASAADADLVGGKIIGIVSDTNQDQLVDDVSLGETGAVTVTLAAGATADNKFVVAVQKDEATFPKRWFVRSVDTTNHTVTVDLGR